jgi:hypothetical protein
MLSYAHLTEAVGLQQFILCPHVDGLAPTPAPWRRRIRRPFKARVKPGPGTVMNHTVSGPS